jgi:hypothetical protein
MSSKKMLDVDLERDMPLTLADIDALERGRRLRPLPTADYLRWLTLMSTTIEAEHRLNTDEDEPFTLL